MKRALIAAAVALFAFPLAAADAPLVVDSSWLKEHLKDKNLVLLHLGDKAEYDKQHLPGARYVTQRDVSVGDMSPTGLNLEMPPADDLRQRLETLGISDSSRVVVYYGNDWVSPTTRIIFTLDYAGLGGRTSLLDGGMQEWIRRGGTVTAAESPATKGKLAPLKVRPIIADAKFVRAHLQTPGYAIVDGRDAVFFDGVDTGGHPQHPDKTGHIAGAHSIPFGSVVDDHNLLIPTAGLRALFEKAGVKPGDTVIGYCHIGQQTTAMLFGARLLGHKVLLYDGSFQDWSRQPDSPVENPSAKAAQ